MERRGRARSVSQALLPAPVESLERAALEVFLWPASRVDGHYALAVGVGQPVRAARPAIIAKGAGDEPRSLAAPRAASVGGTSGPVGFEFPESYPI